MRPPLALAVLLAALALAACGAESSSSGEFEGQQQAVADVVDDLAAAGKAADAQKICDDLLTRAFAERLAAGAGDCADQLEKSIEDADEFDLTVSSVAVRGAAATARVDDDGRIGNLQFARQGNSWRATGIALGR